MLSDKLKQRFCKDYNVPLKIYIEPVFTNRIELFGFKDLYNKFEEMVINDFNSNEKEFLDYYDKIKEEAIEFIKNTDTYKILNECDISNYDVKDKGSLSIQQKDVYKENNIGKSFVSIDLRKANYTSLKIFEELLGKIYTANFPNTYEEFIKQFTSYDYFINSKYLRQVIFGNCNPKRQIKIEKWYMNRIMRNYIPEEIVYSMNNDEIILDADKVTSEIMDLLKTKLDSNKFKIEEFSLEKIKGSDTFIKRFKDNSYELKCMPAFDAVFIYKFLNNQDYTRDDRLFITSENRLAEYIDIPKFEIIKEENNIKNINDEENIELD
jgi:hypothetical protein